MPSLNLIPFGLDTASGQLVDVTEVARGAACGCICPSCRLPLVAKQGELNRWYFSHRTRAEGARIEVLCEYSFWVGLALMARQDLEGCRRFVTPGYELIGYVRTPEGPLAIKQTVTKGQTLALEQVRIGGTAAGETWDAVLQGEAFTLGLALEHEGRRAPAIAGVESEVGYFGAVAIDLADAWLAAERKADQAGLSMRTAFGSTLRDDLAGKRWLFHPREAAQRGAWLNAMREAEARFEPIPKQGGPKQVRCFRCQTTWFKTAGGRCPGCGRTDSWIPLDV